MQKLKISINIKAIIFDMEGVIVNSEKIWQEQETVFMRQFIPSFPKTMPKEYIGGSIERTFELFKKQYNIQIEKQEFLQKYREFGVKNIFPYCDLSPNFLDFLKNISQTYPIALASSSPHVWINFVLDKFDLRNYFREVVSADDILGKGKPEPDIYLFVAKKIKIYPAKCLVFEDSDNGVVSAKLAGMQVYGFRNGYNDEQVLTKADKVFKDFGEIKF